MRVSSERWNVHILSLQRRNVHNGQNVVTFIMCIIMSTEGGTDRRAEWNMRINIYARQAK